MDYLSYQAITAALIGAQVRHPPVRTSKGNNLYIARDATIVLFYLAHSHKRIYLKAILHVSSLRSTPKAATECVMSHERGWKLEPGFRATLEKTKHPWDSKDNPN